MEKSEMSASEILSLVFNRDAVINTFWTVYLAGIGAIGVLIANGMNKSASVKLVAIAVFAAFTVSNIWAIWQPYKQRAILLSMIPDEDPALHRLRHDFASPPKWKLVGYHVIFDAAIILAIIFIKINH